ncbi:MAG: DUF3291 domain-containing protein [Pseudomonadota bacterium]
MELAEVNIARLRHPFDHPATAEFVGALDRINALAERMPGFVWRHIDTGGSAALSADPMVITNLCSWRDLESLRRFVWGTLHARFVERKAEWFEVFDTVHFAMWSVPPGHSPSMTEAAERLAHLEQYGPSDHAFGWDSAPRGPHHREDTEVDA